VLGASRAEIEADLEKVGQPWREDRSNADLAYARNRVRHQVIPALLEAVHHGGNAAARSALARRAAATARELRGVRRLVESQARTALEATKIAGRTGLDCARLCTYPWSIRRLALGLLWRESGPKLGLTARHLDGLVALAARRAAGRMSLPGGMVAERTGVALRIHRARRGIEAGARGLPEGESPGRKA
jgi:tRNA(Ile)-lysidine synthase